MTINMLLTSRADPTKYVYEVLEEEFDYNTTLLTPSKSKLLIFKPSSGRAALGMYAVSRWWVGTVMHHYRCGRNWISMNQSIQISQTAKLLPVHCSVPEISEEDSTMLVSEELVIKQLIQLKWYVQKNAAHQIFEATHQNIQ